jgi:hypothetical protein
MASFQIKFIATFELMTQLHIVIYPFWHTVLRYHKTHKRSENNTPRFFVLFAVVSQRNKKYNKVNARACLLSCSKMLKSCRFVVPKNHASDVEGQNVTIRINNTHINVTSWGVRVTTVAVEMQIIIRYSCVPVFLNYLYGMQVASFLRRTVLSAI